MPVNFVDAAITAGSSLGFQVRQANRDQKSVLLARSSNGNQVEELVRVALQPDGHSMLISVQIAGNYDPATQASTGQLIGQYRDAMVRQP